MLNLKAKFEKPVEIEPGDSFKMVLSKYGAIALDKQENLSDLIGDETGELDLEKGVLSFKDFDMPIQVIGFFTEELNQWAWAWDNEDIFDESLIKSARQMKSIGDEFNIPQLNTPIFETDLDTCHNLAMVTTGVLDLDAYYAVPEEGLSIFVALNSDLIKDNKSPEKFRINYAIFQKNFNVFPKVALEAYTKLNGYIYKPHDDFAVAKIGESRVIVGFTERGNVTHIQLLLED